MSKLLSILAAAMAAGTFWAMPAGAQVTSADHCLKGCQAGAALNKAIARSVYALSNNSQTKSANRIAYRVTAAASTGSSCSRNWARVPIFHPPTPEHDDANVSLGVDRGHQAPLAAFKRHPDWRMTNCLSNIAPQFSKLNQGPWKNLEAAVQNLARRGEGA